ncbi:MAG TPA: CPBP family intramembrane glutamic endopeptidase, partial [Candidatus Binatia bacterium]|nr:CPBP family intramembrane glutamic endopeptidase [Candidatus Binatia bacterium]
DPISQIEAMPPLAVEPLPIPEPAKTEIDLLDVLLVGVAMALAFVVLGTLAATIFILAHKSAGMNPKLLEDAMTKNAFFIVPMQFVIYIAIIGFMALLVWVRHKTSLAQAMHWNLPARGSIWAFALITGTALALVSDVGQFALHRWIPDSLPITEFFKDRPSALLLGAFGILVAPFMEELLFRGFLYPALARSTGATASLIITSSAFTLLHGAQLGYAWAPLLLIFVVGFTLTVTRIRTNSVATCVIVHMTYNFVLLLQTYIATQGFRQMQGL